MAKFVGYICSLCKTEYAPDEITYTCPKDGGNLDVVLDYDSIKTKYHPEDILSRNDPSLWRYLPLLPVSEPPGMDTPLHATDGTPVFALPRWVIPTSAVSAGYKSSLANLLRDSG